MKVFKTVGECPIVSGSTFYISDTFASLTNSDLR